MPRTGKRKPYVVHEKGPGFCRNGHERAVVGVSVSKSGHLQCRKCLSDKHRESYMKKRGAEVIRKRALRALMESPQSLDNDIAEMRKRARANACRDCGGAGHVDTVVGRLCFVCRNRRVESLKTVAAQRLSR